jgi:hypothetical protein
MLEILPPQADVVTRRSNSVLNLIYIRHSVICVSLPLALRRYVLVAQPALFSLGDDNHVRSILNGAGFVDVVCEAVDYNLALGADLDSATDFVINAGSAARTLASLNDQQRTQARAVIRQALAQHQSCLPPDAIPVGRLTSQESLLYKSPNN